LSDLYVMDANFFISLAQTRESRAIERVLNLATGQGWQMHITQPIIKEVYTVRCQKAVGTAADLAKRMMEVHDADDGAIATLRMTLGVNQAPQAPDLSLMALAKQLAVPGSQVRLVSDDFKISVTSRDLGMPYAVISPSVFLFSLSRQLLGEARNLVRMLYRKVRHGEMEYLLSRRDLYNVEEKLTWLMDNLLQTISASTPESSRGSTPARAAPREATTEGNDWEALMRHLRGEHVRRGHLRPFDGIMPYLEPLTTLRPILVQVHDLANAGDLEGGLEQAHEALSDLKSQLQLAVGALKVHEGREVLRAYAELLPDLEMVAALLHVNVGDVADCEDHLDNVALLALAAGLTDLVIETNYLEALIHAYREAWGDALSQFRFSARLAEQHSDGATTLRCLIGSAVMQLLSGDREGAEDTMSDVNARVEEDPAAGSMALEEFGDHFTNFGAIHLASGMYDEALECAVEASLTDDAERLMDKLRRSRLSMGLEGREMAGAIRSLIDHANDIQDKALLERYLEMERDLGRSIEVMAEPLEDLLDVWSPASLLPDPLVGWLDIIRADPLPDGDGTVLVCYQGRVGNIGLLVRDRVNLPGIEHAKIRLEAGAKVKLVKAPEPLRRRHNLRAIIVLHKGDRYEIRRSVMSLRIGGKV
jgi:hypothetical protein